MPAFKPTVDRDLYRTHLIESIDNRLYVAHELRIDALVNIPQLWWQGRNYSSNPDMAHDEHELDLADVVVSYIGLISLATISIYSGSFAALPVRVYQPARAIQLTHL